MPPYAKGKRHEGEEGGGGGETKVTGAFQNLHSMQSATTPFISCLYPSSLVWVANTRIKVSLPSIMPRY